MENPYEPRRPGPYTARVRSPQRRGADYHLPPMGNGRTYDKKHFRREQWTGWLMLLLFIGLPLVYILMIEFGLV
ncbi:MAG: hypothetical protein ACI85K_002047 [Hyphomicrobiaceae bacterium]|jgi:hypothetical protein